MGGRIRLFEPGIVYSSVSRTVDRCFLFTPNHRKDNPLLRFDSSPDALQPGNLKIPKPSIINVIGSSIGRALKENPIDIHWFEGNSNHFHPGFSADEEHLDNISNFFRDAKSLIARGVNATWDREGPVFAGPYRCEPCLDDPSADYKRRYALTNPVKDGLIKRVKQSPFFSTFQHQAYGEPLRFWYIDWAAFWKAGGTLNKKHHPKQYFKWTEWEITPLPGESERTERERRSAIRNQVKEQEKHFEQLLKDENRTVIGVRKLFETDPRDRPKEPKGRGPQPLCHAVDRETRIAYARQWREFVSEHRKASWDFRNGYWEREFPPGSFRPPIIRIITEDGT